ncbi:Ankrd28 [Symbiodinium pilosum]|uniref:Ankrd28 protein n=1 Tax=Symbiodinium pilosum TaxID=2952 RepID=A0A812JGE5_SYMPI|nr:Ankrd28 [Symbiodinium pilosum]
MAKKKVIALVSADCSGCDETPLGVAAVEGQLEGVKLLLKKNATVLARDSSRKTPLCRAAETCQRDVVKLLASLGDVNQLMPEPNGPCLTHR